jgi:hypothetical protein
MEDENRPLGIGFQEQVSAGIEGMDGTTTITSELSGFHIC